MRVYWYADGHFEKATGASIFAESENSDTIEFKLPMASVDSIVHSTFLLPYPQGSEQYGNYRAESLLMHLEQDTVDGGYVWKATIPGGYLANYGTAYISARVESNDLLVVETTEQVRFEIQPGGEYQATPVLPEQGEQIEAHLATIDSTLLSINGDITDLQSTKQDKVDNTLETDTKTVVGAINELNTQINETDTGLKDRLDQAESDISDIEIEQETQNTSIEANTNAINGTAQTKGLLERVADLEDTVITGETYIVTKTGNTLPTTEQLDAWVDQYAEREPQGGDYIYFILEISGETDKNYKYTYSNVSGWSDAVEIPSLESAGNDTKGIVKGSYDGGTLKLFQVNITNGEFQSINVVDNNGTLRELREYLNTNDTTLQNTKEQATENKGNIETNTNDIATLKGQMTNVLDGTTPVGKATKATQDGNGNVITETYQTKAEGVTKQYVKDYAVPRIFNDVYFVATNGYQLEIPTTPASGIQFSTTTDEVGDFEIFLLQHTNNASYELSSKNSSQNAIFVSASVNAQVYFRMTTQVYIENQWKNLSIELSDLKEMTAGEIYKIEFSSSFTSLGNEVVTVEDGGLIRQKFEVMTQSSTTTTFDVYSNETYPSRFNLNTQSETLIVSEAATKININGIYTPVVNFVSDPQTQINAKQEKIDNSNKLDADLVDDTNSTNKFVTASEKSTWNGKQNALSQTQLDAVNSGIDSTKVTQIQTNANDISTKMDKSNPTGTGSFSLNRKANTTIGDYSVALGYNNTASANSSVALGYNCNATAQSSHAEGANSSANGNYSHAEGMTGWANGEASHAEGRQTKALGDYSHAEGYWTTAQRKSQHTFGEYNILDSTGTSTTRGSYVEIVGNGDSNTRSNARTLDWSGNEWLAGKITPTGGISDGNNANYELHLPDTTSWTADKTIATTDDLSDVVTHDDTVTTASETTFADNYYTKTQCDNKYVTQTEFAERYLYYGELARDATYTFGNTLTATIAIQNTGNSITGTTHGRPVLIAGKIFGKFTNMYNATIFITVDNTDYTLVWTNNTTEGVFPFFRIINLAAGVHTFTFKVNGNNPNNTQTLEITNWDADDFTICEL